MVKKYIISLSLIALCLTCFSCTEPEKAKIILESQGYTNIKFTGYDLFACGKDDFYHTGFTATINNNQVSGTICSGLFFKNSTIRFK